jgi:hypothetical protein
MGGVDSPYGSVCYNICFVRYFFFLFDWSSFTPFFVLSVISIFAIRSVITVLYSLIPKNVHSNFFPDFIFFL